MSDPKRHHYLPQFHLRRFGFADGNGLIYRFGKTDGSIARTTVKASAYADDYYKLSAPDGSRDTGIDAMFSQAESNPAPAIARLVALAPRQRHAISEDDQIAIALYLGLLHGRVPGARDPIEDLADFTGKLWLDMQLSSPEAYREAALARGAEDNPRAARGRSSPDARVAASGYLEDQAAGRVGDARGTAHRHRRDRSPTERDALVPRAPHGAAVLRHRRSPGRPLSHRGALAASRRGHRDARGGGHRSTRAGIDPDCGVSHTTTPVSRFCGCQETATRTTSDGACHRAQYWRPIGEHPRRRRAAR